MCPNVSFNSIDLRKLTINFHEWVEFFNFCECEARAKINSVIFSPAGTKLVYIIPLIWDELTINFHEWDQFFNFHECEARVKIMRILAHEWKLINVNFRKSVVLCANSGSPKKVASTQEITWSNYDHLFIRYPANSRYSFRTNIWS